MPLTPCFSPTAWERGDVPCSNSAFLACNPRNATRSQNRRGWERLPLAHDGGEGF
ncbi:MAG: hypothetical protein KatS3mg019_1098 [Fimbriimonadales bacterium]|nr:MAG: hypothetical protein KatS3mg019_1098 [Fimbriimonadales bacterium]